MFLRSRQWAKVPSFLRTPSRSNFAWIRKRTLIVGCGISNFNASFTEQPKPRSSCRIKRKGKSGSSSRISQRIWISVAQHVAISLAIHRSLLSPIFQVSFNSFSPLNLDGYQWILVFFFLIFALTKSKCFGLRQLGICSKSNWYTFNVENECVGSFLGSQDELLKSQDLGFRGAK